MKTKIGFLGAGRMAEALIAGLLKSGFTADHLYVTSRTEARRQQLASRFGVRPLSSAAELVEKSDVVLLAVKPQQLKEAVLPFREKLVEPFPLLISVAAGIETKTLSRWLGRKVPIVRAMPNTPVRVGHGITGLYATPEVSEDGCRLAEAIFQAVGEVVWLEREELLDGVTALSGSGPAYLFYLMEALIEAGLQLGLPEETAQKLASWTVWGAGELAAKENRSPELLRREVTSPGGTTERALAVLEEHRIKEIFERAVSAAWHRAGELARTFTEKD